MNVYPRKPLEAEWFEDAAIWGLRIRPAVTTDAEFAEHFYPAERLDTLIAAVAEECNSHALAQRRVMAELSTAPPLVPHCRCTLCAAFRAFREQVTA